MKVKRDGTTVDIDNLNVKAGGQLPPQAFQSGNSVLNIVAYVGANPSSLSNSLKLRNKTVLHTHARKAQNSLSSLLVYTSSSSVKIPALAFLFGIEAQLVDQEFEPHTDTAFTCSFCNTTAGVR